MVCSIQASSREAPTPWRRAALLERAPRRATVWALAALLTLATCGTGCGRKRKTLEDLHVTQEEAERILAEISSKQHATQAPGADSSQQANDPRPQTSGEPNPSGGRSNPAAAAIDAGALSNAGAETPNDPALRTAVEDGQVNARWIVDRLVDVAPAGPSAASDAGIVVINARNELHLAKRGPLGTAPSPLDTPITALPDSVGPMVLGRAPSLADGHAYWIFDRFLVRRPLAPPHAPLERLADDAHVSTRTSALAAAGPNSIWVAYVALPSVKGGPLRSRLWFGGERTAQLSEPSENALSIALLERGNVRYALSLEARVGQSALHLRRFAPGAAPSVDSHRIVWVGGGANPTTEVRVAATRREEVLGLLPLEHGVTDFGLALLSFAGPESTSPPREDWIGYENGINPAPVDSAELCGRAVVLFARPSTKAPGSPQELVLAEVANGKLEHELVLSTSKAFYDVSLAPVRGGAILSYVADYRTWSRSVRCKPSSR